MNAAAFFITLTLHLPQIQSSALDLMKTRSDLGLKDLKSKKPPCGLSPDVSCEEETTCITVTMEADEKGGKENEDGQPVEKRYETTCIMINLLKKSALRQGPPAEAIQALRQADRPIIVRQRPLTTSTMAPFAGGTTPPEEISVENNCKSMANCHQWKWK